MGTKPICVSQIFTWFVGDLIIIYNYYIIIFIM